MAVEKSAICNFHQAWPGVVVAVFAAEIVVNNCTNVNRAIEFDASPELAVLLFCHSGNIFQFDVSPIGNPKPAP